MATAVLVLGGACGDEGKPSSSSSPASFEGIDTSQARKDAIIEAFCKQSVECSEEDDLAQCMADHTSYLDEYADVTDDCMDAILDYRECYAVLECESIDEFEEAASATEECIETSMVNKRCRGQTED